MKNSKNSILNGFKGNGKKNIPFQEILRLRVATCIHVMLADSSLKCGNTQVDESVRVVAGCSPSLPIESSVS